MSRRIAGVLIAAGLQVVALVLAHELVYLARYGSLYGEALVHAGHGWTWSTAVTTSLTLGALLVIAAAVRLARLGLLVRRHAPAGARPPQAASLAWSWMRSGPRLAFLTAVLLTLQENVERGALAGRAFNPSILLTPEYAGGVWIALAVGLAVGLVAALFQWRHGVLLARLRAARPTVRRRPATASRAPFDARRPIESLLGRRSALRAPPRPVAT